MRDKNNRARQRYRDMSPVLIFGGIIVIVLAVAARSLTVVQAAAPGAVVSQEELYKKGKSSYRKRCARCHGVKIGSPGVGVYNLLDFPLDEQDRFIESVTYGKNAMPSWGDVLKPADIDALWTFISTDSAAAQ